ncbi:DUF4350 domain-containing protein [Chloroflexota bacterium]
MTGDSSQKVRMPSLLFAVVAIVIFISLLCIWFYPSVQDFMASNKMWNGIRDFGVASGANNIDTMGDLPTIPGKTTLIAISYLEYSDEDLLKMKRFVDDGGTLLLMDDYGYGNDVLTYLGTNIRFSNKPLLDPLFCYRNQWIPRITDFAPEVKESGINVILLNHATALTNLEETQVIAWSSEASFLDMDEDEAWSQEEPKGPFPVAGKMRYGKGELAIVSDPSIIISSMIGRDDNYRFVEYLTHYDDEQKEILVDSSHLSDTPLDVSKTRLTSAREWLSKPYALVGIIALIFVTVSRYTLKKGETIGRN